MMASADRFHGTNGYREQEMYRVEVGGVPIGSEWDIQPSAFPTRDEAFQFALGIGKTLLAMPWGNGVKISDLTVSIIEPTGSRETWSPKELLVNAFLFGQWVSLKK
jgi:hypothetical protein